MQNKQLFPASVHSGFWHGGHVQGIAIDEAAGFLYYSFTTFLLKTDFSGKPVGSVKGIVGHLGCITFDPDRRRVYGSLELKHDAIGAGIMAYTGKQIAREDAFYCVSFDCDRIDRMDMDAERDGVMQAVWLPEVVADYSGTELDGTPHRYGCSGIDGTAYGPVFGAPADSPRKIMIAYGVYGDTRRQDNDYQVILQFDPDMFAACGQPLNQIRPHHSGCSCEKRYFFYTGNTEWGIQNLEYDAHSRTYLAAVYPGTKEAFANYPLFFLDAQRPPEEAVLSGRNGERGLCLFPAHPHGAVTDDRGGCDFSWGSTGAYAFGDGRFAFSRDGYGTDADGKQIFASQVVRYRLEENDPNIFAEG